MSRRPFVVACAGSRDLRNDAEMLAQAARRPIVLEHLSWWAGNEEGMRIHLERQRWLGDRGIEHHLVVNGGDEDELRRKVGVRGAWCSKNLYADESVFVLKSEADDDGNPFARIGVDGRFDAVYIAQLAPFKRLELARDIAKLLVICGRGDLHAYCPELAHATYSRRWMPPWAVAACVRHSHCGLALSEREGQNNATVEYLLCGVPVVSTTSHGGRDLFLDGENSVVVEPCAARIAEAVSHFRAEAPNPSRIRTKTLNRITAWRMAFCRYVAGLLDDHGCEVDPGRLAVDLFGSPEAFASRLVEPSLLTDARALESRGPLSVV